MDCVETIGNYLHADAVSDFVAALLEMLELRSSDHELGVLSDRAIFFVRASRDMKRRMEGRGLGVGSSFYLASSCNGNVEVEF